MVPLKEAIVAGADEIDVVLATGPKPQIVTGKFKTLEVLTRSLSLMMDEFMEKDLKTCALKNRIDGYVKVKLNIYRSGLEFKNNSLCLSIE